MNPFSFFGVCIIFPFWFLTLNIRPHLPHFFLLYWPVVYQLYWSSLLFLFANVHISVIISIASLVPFVRGNLRNIKVRGGGKRAKFSSKGRVCGRSKGRGGKKGRRNDVDRQRELGKFPPGGAPGNHSLPEAEAGLHPPLHPPSGPSALSAHQPNDLQDSSGREEKTLEAVPEFGRDFGAALSTLLYGLLLPLAGDRGLCSGLECGCSAPSGC